MRLVGYIEIAENLLLGVIYFPFTEGLKECMFFA
jgi:hypothetical protein